MIFNPRSKRAAAAVRARYAAAARSVRDCPAQDDAGHLCLRALAEAAPDAAWFSPDIPSHSFAAASSLTHSARRSVKAASASNAPMPHIGMAGAGEGGRRR
eukprot:CAMPEP_0171984930 /NCGR_PEP_ID=MMETSP0993-20121228/274083_1 /TAXON_ID=483369 /ORGANISM="non described non described, Strain CCMP2098" /LENGTH=100 /DNA_ID=CAMNT_0012637769 /DNA_START=524 /DNA_END=827 /DNA_ORIENTATION=-